MFDTSSFLIARIALTALSSGLSRALTPVEGEREVLISIELNLLVWFGVLSLIVLAEVFREGARLRNDQQLTI